MPDEESQGPSCNIFSKDCKLRRSNGSVNIAHSVNLRLINIKFVNYIHWAPHMTASHLIRSCKTFLFVYYKRSKAGDGDGLGTKLTLSQQLPLFSY